MKVSLGVLAVSLAAALAWSAPAAAHCDTLDGPVVSAARKGLDSGDVSAVLAWVQQGDEREIRQAFDKARAVRKSGGAAKELADHYFFETLVRVHRAGEGAPYTGLKAEGIEPAIAAADRALVTGKLEPVAKMLVERTHQGLHGQFERVSAKKAFDPKDVEAGRAYVAAYVQYVHYVEGVYNAAATPAAAHGAAHAAPSGGHAH